MKRVRVFLVYSINNIFVDWSLTGHLEEFALSKVSITEAVSLTGLSESTIRRVIKSGKVSASKDNANRWRIDVSELERVYDFRPRDDSVVEQSNDLSKTIILLENQVADLRSELERSHEREIALLSDKSKLLDLFAAEKAEKLALMPPSEEEDKSWGWLRRLFGW